MKPAPARATALAPLSLPRSIPLFEDEIETSPTYAYPDDPNGWLHLLEATPTRVKVRQDASYFASGGGAQLAGVRGVGDYAIYPAGRMAIGWRRKTTTAQLTSGRHERLGDAIAAAQRAYAQSGLMPELLSIYQLLGDPAMTIR